MHLLNQSVPELDMDEIDLGLQFLDKELEYPVVINALTGGTDQAQRINQGLAELAGRYGLAMAVGSQTIAINDPGLRDTFSIVRDINPEGIILANVGAGSGVEEALTAIEMIDADALQLHFNVPQELAMQEGDRSFKGIMDKVASIAAECPVPVIAKEVGFGLSRESVEKLYSKGIKIFDNGGSGGTNFISIEAQRRGIFSNDVSDWGIPTAASLGEICSMDLPITIIASGGIRSALDSARAIAMGAALVGIAGPLLKIFLQEGIDKLDAWMEQFLFTLKSIFLMNAARTCEDIKKHPVIITGFTAEWLKARGIDPAKWSNR